MAFELIPLKPEQHTLTFVPRLSVELPFFNLTARRKDIPKVIKYEGRDDYGRPIRWEVYQDQSEEIGAPAVEAHEVWHLLVKPSIDGQRRANGTIPEIIPLGGIRECLRKVGWSEGGFQGRELIKALTQISFAGCVADLWLPTGVQDEEGKQRFLQIKGRFSRMSVYAIGEHHLTEEELAQSKFEFELEDILYIRLDPLEARLQQLQDRRILDNQYLFSISPAARRWYELMAAKIFGVVSNKGNFCEIRYSWYVKHHHTLKRQYLRFRVVEQMKRVVRDHMESGYLANVEYRAVKERDQEVDYIIRYYPGPGAAASMDRIQTHIRHRRIKPGPLSRLQPEHQRTNSPELPQINLQALSLFTSDHERIIVELMFKFGIGWRKAFELGLSRKEATMFQLEVWPFREVGPRNRAGWIIQAIENNYQAPASYAQYIAAQDERQKVASKRHLIQSCSLCDVSGFRRIRTIEYPSGAMRQCTHTAAIERQYLAFRTPIPKQGVSPDAKNSRMRGEKDSDDERAAEGLSSP